MVNIIDVNQHPETMGIASMLFLEYAVELNVDLCFQNFQEELDDPLIKYGLPYGALLLAINDDEPVACVALQTMDQSNTCEMKRLYVRPAFRNKGIAQMLVSEILKKATDLKYEKMVLDTLTILKPAIQLYKRNGFLETNAYYKNPLDGVIYMSKTL